MAKSDDTEETTPTTSSDIATAVGNASSVDESVADDDDEEKDDDSKAEAGDDGGDDKSSENTEGDDDSGKPDDDDSKGDSKEDGDSKPTDKKDSGYRYTQFAGDGKPESYISNLEKAYENSSAEGIKLNQALTQATQRVNAIMDAVKGDQDLANKLHAALTGTPSAAAPAGEAAPTTDPFLVDAKTKWEKTSTEEAEAFIKANPEVVSNPTINTEVKRWMEVFSNEVYKTEGRLMTAGEAMAQAYKHLGYEDKREASKELNDAKGAMTPTKPQAPRKSAKTGSDFTDSQVAIAEKMGLSKDKLDKFAK